MNRTNLDRAALKRCKDEVVSLVKQRDALLSACKRLLKYHYHNDLGVKPKEYHEAVAAINKAK